jgi:hypothetical protein
MSVSEDVANLFGKFGGQPEQYQEIGRDEDAKAARANWPLLASIQVGAGTIAPAVGRPGVAPSAPADLPVPASLPVQAAPVPHGISAIPAPQAAPAAAATQAAATSVATTPTAGLPSFRRPLRKHTELPEPAPASGAAEPAIMPAPMGAHRLEPVLEPIPAARSVSAGELREGGDGSKGSKGREGREGREDGGRAEGDEHAAHGSKRPMSPFGRLARLQPAAAPDVTPEAAPAAVAGSRDLQHIFARIAAAPVPGPAPDSEPSSLFRRLSRL